MVLITRCPTCGYRLRFPDDQAGQSVRCFSCQAECTLPTAETPGSGNQIQDEQTDTPDSRELDHASTAAGPNPAETTLADRWWARTPTGEDYGPVAKLELENWVAEGRIDPTFQLRQGEGPWHPAADILPGLSGDSATDPTSVPVSRVDDSPFAPVTLVDESPFQSTKSSNPFQPPRQDHLSQASVTPGILDAPSAEQLRNRVQLPALFLIICGCLTLLLQMLQIVGYGFNLADGFMNQGRNPFAIQRANSSLILTITFLVISVGSSIVTVYGAFKMRQLRSYGFAVTACVLPMIPCMTSCCCGLALPFSIWGLVVLLDPNVRSLFDQPVAFHTPA